MTGKTSQVMNTARQWMLRVNEPDFSDWDAFTAWLEAGSNHLAAYEAALREDSELDRLQDLFRLAQPAGDEVAQDPAPAGSTERQLLPWQGWRMVMTGAIAASLVAAVSFTGVLNRPGLTSIETEYGAQRSVTLADNSRMDVNGGSTVRYDPDRPRRVMLDAGEALFEVMHDDGEPFVVQVGTTQLVDIGTVFNVVHGAAGRLDVAVAEGAVLYRHGGEEIRLEAGDRLLREQEGAKLTLLRADPETIGSWQEGVLVYDNAVLDQIAGDLSRQLAKPVVVTGTAGRIRYTGTLSTVGEDGQIVAAVSALLGVRMRETDDAWEMAEGDDPAL